VLRPGSAFNLAPAVSPKSSGYTYQWKFSNGETTVNKDALSTLSIVSVGTSDSGTYTLFVTDGDVVSSGSMALQVRQPIEFDKKFNGLSLPPSISVEAKGRISLRVAANASPDDGPLRYQWRFNGQAIRGGTQDILSISSAVPANAGTYDVIAFNNVDRVKSDPCTVAITELPRIVGFGFVSEAAADSYSASASVRLGAAVHLKVALNNDKDATYEWVRGTLRSAKVISGTTKSIPDATKSTLVINPASNDDEGWYMVVVRTPRGRLVSSPVKLNVNDPVTFMAGGTLQTKSVLPGQPVKLEVKVTGTGPLLYQWTLNGTPIIGGTSPVFTGDFEAKSGEIKNISNSSALKPGMVVTSGALPDGSGVTVMAVDTTRKTARLSGAATQTVAGAQFSVALNSINIPSVGQTDAGTYTVVVSNPVRPAESSAQLLVTKPVTILSEPEDVRARAAVEFKAELTAGGNVALVNASDLTGVAEGMLVTLSGTGQQKAFAVDTFIRTIGASEDPAKRKLILSEPSSITATGTLLTAGEVVTLKASIDAEGDVAYQWRRNGFPITGATLGSLVIKQPRLLDSGWYDVKISNKKNGVNVSQVISRSAQLQVFQAPQIWVAPVARVLNTDGIVSARMEVTVFGSGPLQYAWQKLDVGTLAVGAPVLSTSELYEVSPATDVHSGTYRVTVTGPLGDTATADSALSSVSASSSVAFLNEPQTMVTGVEGNEIILSITPNKDYTVLGWWGPSAAVPSGTLLSGTSSVGSGSLLSSGNYSFIPASISQSGFYQAVAVSTSDVSNAGATRYYSAPTTVVVNPRDPLYGGKRAELQDRFTLQQQMMAGEGSTANFRIMTIGEGLSYAWEFAPADGSPVVSISTSDSRYRGADSVSLSIRGVTARDEGTYTAVVTIPGGTGAPVVVRSIPWTLSVNALPVITADPVVNARKPGETATLSIGGIFNAETKFVWYVKRAGEDSWVPVPSVSSTDPTKPFVTKCELTNVQPSDEGEYRVEVSNSVGTVVSAGTYMTVYKPASIALGTSSAGTVQTGTVFGVIPGGTLNLQPVWSGDLVANQTITFEKLGARNIIAQVVPVTAASGTVRISRSSFTDSSVIGETSSSGTLMSGTLIFENVSDSIEGFYRVSAGAVVNGVVQSALVKVDVYDRVAFASNAGITSVVSTAGDAFSIKAPVTGYNPVVEWFLNGGTTAIASGSVYSVKSATSADAGTYTVKVSNGFSSVTKVLAQVKINAAPVITFPTEPISVNEGTAFTITGRLSGTVGNARYQWRKEGKAIPNAFGTVFVTDSGVSVTFSRPVAAAGDDGFYDLLVSNQYGASASSLLRVDVFAKPEIAGDIEDSVVFEGGSAVFRVQAIGDGTVGYQWYKNNAPVGTGDSVLTLPSLGVVDDNSKVFVVLSNQAGTATSRAATLRVAADSGLSVGAIQLNGSASSTALALVGSNTLTTSANAVTTGSLAFQWRRNGSVVFSGQAPKPSSGTQFALSYRLPALNPNSDGVYDVVVDNGAGVALSSAISLTVDPKIVSVDIPKSANPGDAVKMSVNATTSAGLLSYQWYKAGTPISDANSSEYRIGSIAAGDAALYRVRVSKSAGAFVESGSVQLSVANSAVITKQPEAPATLGANGTLVLTVQATGDDLSYEWSQDGKVIVGANGSTLTRTKADSTLDGWAGLAGAYQVKVRNAFSSAVSKVVAVQVSNELGVGLLQPDPVEIGGVVNLIATASGPEGVTYAYQWKKGAVNLAGKTGETLKISPVAYNDGGLYSVSVTAGTAEVLSGSVNLVVNDAPRILVPLVSRTVSSGSSATFKVVAESRIDRTKPLFYDWRRGDQVIQSGASNTLVLSNVSTGSIGAYSVTVSMPSDRAAGTASSTATLSVLASGSVPKTTTAGSDGVSVHTAWWVYWVKATNANGEVRNGYYALERELTGGSVTPKRALWLWADDTISPVYSSDEWSEADQTVLDAVASQRGEFSVLGFRSSPSGDYAISGRVEEQGDGSLYGAPDLAEGSYVLDGEEYSVELTWDMEQVYNMDTVLGTTEEKLNNVKAELKAALQKVLDNID
jgi:hypothetical protein